MKAEEKKFLQFLEGADKNFIIPVYQRNYDWKKEQCKQLFDDIIQITKEEYRTHFMGTIVAYNDDGYGNNLLIIDGQQRLTTLSILLLAIYKILDEGIIESKEIIKEKIYDEYLINKYSIDKSKKIRLKPVKNDKEAFNSIFSGDRKEDSNIVINYNYFYERIKNNEISIDSLFKAIEQLIVVEIRLKKGEDDPQLIFESLNSTGLDLSEADKVRNYILMGQDTDKQEKLYNEYWNKIEINTNYDVSKFLRDYLTLKEKRIPNKGKVYIHFKDYILKNSINIEQLLIDLLKFANYFGIIINAKDDDKEISNILKRINKLETDVSYPFLIDLYDKLNDGIITKNELQEILSIIESYIFRRFICNVPTNALNKTFMLLGKDIESNKQYKEKYLDIFKYVLINKEGAQRFPKNEEFADYLKIRDIYGAQGRNKLHLLERLESYDNRESDIERLINDGILSIEHIMPQHLTYDRQKNLGDDYKRIHETYLHTLSNLTLTGYNSKYSNKTFEEKRKMEKGFNDSPLYLNQFLKTLNSRGENEILERYKILKNKAQEIRFYPNTKYIIEKDEAKIFTLSDDKVFTGEKILEFIFENTTYKVNSRATFYENLIKLLYDKDPILMKSFVNDEYLSTRFSKSKLGDSYYYTELCNDLYIKIGLDTERILSTLRQIFDKYKIDLDDLTFYIK